MKKGIVKVYSHKSLPYRLLVIALVILVVLIFIWVFLVFRGEKRIWKFDKNFRGELGTSGIFGSGERGVEVYDYNLTNNNQSINMTLYRGGKVISIDAVLIVFKRSQGDCNYTLSSNLPPASEEKNYVFNVQDTNCGENFTDVFNVSVFGINLIIDIGCNDSDMNPDYPEGKNYLLKGIIINSSENKTDYCFDNRSVREYFCNNDSSINSSVITCPSAYYCNDSICVTDESINIPKFLYGKCGEISWEVNTNYTLNVSECFEDEDNDNLTYRYSNLSTSKISIRVSDEIFRLIPNENWTGRGYFNVYANDSHSEKIGQINFEVFRVASNRTINRTVNKTEEIEIKNPNPKTDDIEIYTGEDKIFSIENTDYDKIRWYLNNYLVKENSNFYKTGNLSEGDYDVKVVINKGESSDVKNWKLVVKTKEESKKSSGVGGFVFYVIIVVILLIIMLVIWLIIIEKNRRADILDSKVKISGINESKKLGPSSNQFNIPS